jgi:hypothetical protein
MSLQATINYDNAANFTFDSDLIEIVGGKAQLKNQIDPDEMFFANFSSKDLLRAAGGSLVGTLGGGASVTTVLRMNNAVSNWDGVLTGKLGDDPHVCAISFKVTPFYNGAPATDQTLYLEQEAVANQNNRIWIRHVSSGNLTIEYRNSIGGGVGTLSVPWSPISGTQYDIELNHNSLVDNSSVLFINGAPVATHIYTAYTRTTALDFMRVGSAGIVQNFNLDDLQRFDKIKNTSDFSSQIPRTISETTYPTTNPTIESNSGFGATEFSNFSEVTTKPGSDEIKYTFRWSNSLWYLVDGLPVVSDGTYAQTNTAAEIAAAGTIDVDPNSTIYPITHLHSDDGSTTPDLTSISFNYNLFVTRKETPKCACYGYVMDGCNPISGATVKFFTDDPYSTQDNQTSINEVATTNSAGYYAVTLPEGATAGQDISALIEWTDSQNQKQVWEQTIRVPNQASAAVEDIVVAA